MKRSMKMKKTIVIALVLILLATCAKKETANNVNSETDGTVNAGTFAQSAEELVKSGIAHYEKQDYDKAIADYTEAIKLKPDFAGLYENRGYTYFIKKDYDNAIADYTEAIRLKPRSDETYNNRGYAYYEKKDYDKAIADYTAALSIEPDDDQILHNRGIAYYDKHDYNRAIADWENVLRINPKHPTARLDIEEAQQARGN